MSLINDALKKAQKQREVPPATPPPGGPPPSTPLAASPSPGPARGSHFTLLIAGAAVLVSASVAVTVYLLRSDGRPENRLASGSVQTPPSAPTTPAAGVPITTPTSSSLPSARSAPVVPQNETVAASTPASSVSMPVTAAGPTTTPAATPYSTPPAVAPVTSPFTPTPVVTAPAEAAPVKASLRVQGMIDKFRIAGIRLSGTESKVILNDHLFRVNDLVESSLGLRLLKIESHVLTFVDGEGNTYLKRF